MRKFGIEIECEIDASRALEALRPLSEAGDIMLTDRVCGYHSDERYQAWKVERDSSVDNGCEIVSPILSGSNIEDSFEQIRKVVRALARAGAGVNRTCGLHVHINAEGMDVQWVKNLCKRYSDNSSIIDSFMPASRRRGSRWANTYCSALYENAFTSRAYTTADDLSAMTGYNSPFGRTSVINLVAYARTGTIEFRQHSGTLNAEKITNWVSFLQAFVEASKPARTRRSPRRRRNNTSAGVRLSPKREKLVEALRCRTNVGAPARRLAALSGMTEGSVVATISYLRRDGFEIKKNRTTGYYILVSEPRASLVTELAARVQEGLPPTLASIWTGVDPSVVQFYQERAAELG